MSKNFRNHRVVNYNRKSWRLHYLNRCTDLRQELFGELFNALQGESREQNLCPIKNLCLCSNAQHFGFCLRCRCLKKDLNQNLVIQEGAKIHFPSKAVLISTFLNISLQTVKTIGDTKFCYLFPKCQYVTLKWHFNRIFSEIKTQVVQ